MRPQNEHHEKRSFIRTMQRTLGLQLVVITLLLILTAIFSYKNALEQTRASQKNILDIYSRQIENRLNQMDHHFATVISDTYDLTLLKNPDEAQRHYAAIRIREQLSNIMSIDQSADMLLVASPQYDFCIDAISRSLGFQAKNALRAYFSDYAANADDDDRLGWHCIEAGGDWYLRKSIRQDGYAAAVIVSCSGILKPDTDLNLSSMSFFLTNEDGTVMAGTGDRHGSFSDSSLLCSSRPIMEGKLELLCVEKKTALIRNLYFGMVVIFLIIILLLAVIFLFIKQEKQLITQPMNRLIRVMERIGKGDYKLRIEEENSEEFSLLTQTFNSLMDELVDLKVQYYEKKIALSDAEQKYIRLQIRPHFFLNALTTIGSLSAKGKTREIEVYIRSLSRNIRYMFSSGLHTVPLEDEIRHVENYFDMQSLRYPDCLFYYIDIPESVREWKIPQMLIHTLIENEYKYAVSKDTPLMVLIRASKIIKDGEEMLLLEVEDDGKGYPGEVLSYMNAESGKENDGSRVGLWSIRRLLELMYDRKGLLEISNVPPHGALNRILIPAEPVNERGKEYLEEKGIV